MKKLFTLLTCFTFLASTMNAQIFSEDFEGGEIPSDWTHVTDATDGGWLVGTASDLSSPAYPFGDHTTFAATNDDDCNCDKLLETLTTPEFDVPDGEGVVVLTFAYSFVNGDYDADETAKVFIIEGANTTEIADFEGGSYDWMNFSYDLANYAGQTIQIMFEYSDGGGWNYAYGIDDVLVAEYTGSEASMVSVDNFWFAEAGDQSVEFTVSNSGAENITTFDVDWDVNGTVTSETFSSDIGFGGQASFATVGTFAVEANTDYDITVTLTSVNGSADNIGTASAMGSVGGVEYYADRVVVIEEATGTWCGWCPRGTVFMEQMGEDYPETTFLSAVHNGDPMVVSEYDAGIGPNIPGYPSGLVDRAATPVDPQDFPTAYMAAMEVPSVIDLSGTTTSYDAGTGVLTIDVDCKFLVSTDDDFRLNVVISEDGLSGTSSQWNQANYYSGGGNGPMGGFEDLSDPVPAADMIYDHVAMAILGGWDGTDGSLPASIESGVTNEYTYTWDVPSTSVLENMHIGVMVINQTTGVIENAFKPMLTVGIQENNAFADFSIYPNPANDVAHISFNLLDNENVRLEVIDLLGKVVYVDNYGTLPAGNQLIDVDANNLENGMYIFNVYAGSSRISQRVSISK